MATVRETIQVSDLGRDAEGVLNGLRASDQPLVITRDGKAAAVLMSIGNYERMEYERGLLLSLARGERDIAAGRTHDLDSVLAEMDASLVEGEG